VKFDAYVIPPAVSVAESLAYLQGVVGAVQETGVAAR
jgi:hypothetical protein